METYSREESEEENNKGNDCQQTTTDQTKKKDKENMNQNKEENNSQYRNTQRPKSIVRPHQTSKTLLQLKRQRLEDQQYVSNINMTEQNKMSAAQ